jgi:hypothetical protein
MLVTDLFDRTQGKQPVLSKPDADSPNAKILQQTALFLVLPE